MFSIWVAALKIALFVLHCNEGDTNILVWKPQNCTGSVFCFFKLLSGDRCSSFLVHPHCNQPLFLNIMSVIVNSYPVIRLFVLRTRPDYSLSQKIYIKLTLFSYRRPEVMPAGQHLSVPFCHLPYYFWTSLDVKERQTTSQTSS